MNAVYALPARMAACAKRWGHRAASPAAELNNKQLNDYISTPARSPKFFHPPDISQSPRVLKDGADSVGVLGALNRVYLNIGLFSEEWLLSLPAPRRRPVHHTHRDRRRRQATPSSGRPPQQQTP